MDLAWLVDSIQKLTHRGPDSKGSTVSLDQKALLGHTRLAILDLSELANQPMTSVDESISLVFNGEIYNFAELRELLWKLGHVFLSDSDTEVILNGYREWGTSVVKHIEGAFAFALYDSDTEILLLARDRMGEKPLYYSQSHNYLVFGSEVKTIINTQGFERKVNLAALQSYLSYGYCAPDHSLIKGIRKLEPGCFLTWNGRTSQLTTERYWNLPEAPEIGHPYDVDEATNNLERHLRNAVATQLIADVPVGVLLSGGVDSSIIVALASQVKHDVKTFSVIFPGHRKFDEAEHSRTVAQFFGTDHMELPASDLKPDILFSVMKGMDDPIADSSAIATFVLANLVTQHCKVVLGGDGADELFGGYIHYQHLLKLQKITRHTPRFARRTLAKSLLTLTPIGFKGRYWLENFGRDLYGETPILNQFFSPGSILTIPSEKAIPDSQLAYCPTSGPKRRSDLLGRAIENDLRGYLPEDILIKLDRMSMLNSLEIRAPFLDRALIDFVRSTYSSDQLVNGSMRKIPLIALARRLLPQSLNVNRKQGLSIPLLAWIRSDDDWRKFFEDTLLGSEDCFHDRELARKLLSASSKGRDTSQQIYSLTVLELWRKQYGMGI